MEKIDFYQIITLNNDGNKEYMLFRKIDGERCVLYIEIVNNNISLATNNLSTTNYVYTYTTTSVNSSDIVGSPVEVEPNVYYFGGYDGSIVSFLTGSDTKEAKTPTNAEELFQAAMDQQVMKMIEI